MCYEDIGRVKGITCISLLVMNTRLSYLGLYGGLHALDGKGAGDRIVGETGGRKRGEVLGRTRRGGGMGCVNPRENSNQVTECR